MIPSGNEFREREERERKREKEDEEFRESGNWEACIGRKGVWAIDFSFLGSLCVKLNIHYIFSLYKIVYVRKRFYSYVLIGNILI